MSSKRWLASFFALALSTQLAFGQVPDEEVVPGEQLPFAPIDSAPPATKTGPSSTDANWAQVLVDHFLSGFRSMQENGNVRAVRAVTVDPAVQAIRNVRTVVQYMSADEGCPFATQNAKTMPSAPPCCPPPCCAQETPACCGQCVQAANCRPVSTALRAGWNFSFTFPCQGKFACCSGGTTEKPACCGTCGCKSYGPNAAYWQENPCAVQLPMMPHMAQFAPYGVPNYLPPQQYGPVLQHAPIAVTGYAPYGAQPWMVSQQWLPPPAWGQPEWAQTPPIHFIEWNHPVAWTKAEEPTTAVYQVVAKGDAVYLNTPNLEARCQRMTYVGTRDRVLLEGNVRLVCKKGTDVTRIEAPRLMVDLVSGTFTVEAGNGSGRVNAAPTNVGSCPAPQVGPLGTWGEFWERMCGGGQEWEAQQRLALPPPLPPPPGYVPTNYPPLPR